MKRLQICLSGLLVALVGACTSTMPDGGGPPAAIVFPVIGDIPYSDEDRYVLEEQVIPAIKEVRYPFVIHIGDYKDGGAPCVAAHDDAFTAMVEQLAPIPVFYTPGDNEWTDCDRFKDLATGQPASELARLDHLRSVHFHKLVDAPDAMMAVSQDELPENVMWRDSEVLFATVHIVGTGNGRRAVMGDDVTEAGRRADTRESAALAWIAKAAGEADAIDAKALIFAVHADLTDVDDSVLGTPCVGAYASREQRCDAFVSLRDGIRDAAVRFGGPTLVIHGDTAPFSLSQSFSGDEAGNLWILNAAGDHGITPAGFHYGVPDATLVSVQPGADKPFSSWAIASGAKPEAK